MRIRPSIQLLITSSLLVLTHLGHAEEASLSQKESQMTPTAIFAGGCFWCIEADFESVEGVIDVVSGYTGGSAETADYKTVTYTNSGHYEAVKVSYDPSLVDYSTLVDFFWRHIDPTDPEGQFCDKGASYRAAIFTQGLEQRQIAEASLARLETNKPFDADIVTPILEAMPFYLAEDYHQDYYKKNPWRYKYYRAGCGRDRRVNALWGQG